MFHEACQLFYQSIEPVKGLGGPRGQELKRIRSIEPDGMRKGDQKK